MALRILLVLAGVAAAGCSTDVTGGSVDGPELFSRLCSRCHGPTGKPPASMEVSLRVRDLTAPAMRAKMTPALVEEQIRRGSENKIMPSFVDLLNETQIKALGAYVASPEFLAPR